MTTMKSDLTKLASFRDTTDLTDLVYKVMSSPRRPSNGSAYVPSKDELLDAINKEIDSRVRGRETLV